MGNEFGDVAEAVAVDDQAVALRGLGNGLRERTRAPESTDPRAAGTDELAEYSADGTENPTAPEISVEVVVNGRVREVHQRELSFLEIVRLGYPDATLNETTIHTVTYKRGPTSSPQGSLVDGLTVRVRKGMIFNVTATDKS